MRHSRSRRNSVRSCPVRSGAQSGALSVCCARCRSCRSIGVPLKWLHRGIGALIGKGAYVMPFALIGIAVLLFARPKGPVRLRGTCIALMPLLIGSISHAFSCANEYDLSMSTLSGLLSTGMEGSSGGLLGGGLYILLEWALLSPPAHCSSCWCCSSCRRRWPAGLRRRRCTTWFVRPSTNTRTRRNASATKHLSSCRTSTKRQLRVHSVEKERRAHRKSDFDIPIDTDPPGEDKLGRGTDRPAKAARARLSHRTEHPRSTAR